MVGNLRDAAKLQTKPKKTDMILKYFKKVKDEVDNFNHIVISNSTNEKVYSDKRGFIEGKVDFTDESRLEFTEVKDVEFENKMKYSYHYMDKGNAMQFRYDNTKHHPDISTYPHHKHTSSGIEPSKEPEISDVLSEIEKEVLKKR